MLKTFQKDNMGFGEDAVIIDAGVAIRLALPKGFIIKMCDACAGNSGMFFSCSA